MKSTASSSADSSATGLVVTGLRAFLRNRRETAWRMGLSRAGLEDSALDAFRRLIELHEAFGLLEPGTGAGSPCMLSGAEARLLLALRLIQQDMRDDAAAVFHLALPAAAARLAMAPATLLAHALARQSLLIATPFAAEVPAGAHRAPMTDPGLQRLQ